MAKCRAIVAFSLLLLLRSNLWSLANEPEPQQETVPKKIAGIEYKNAKKFDDPRLGFGLMYHNESETLTIYVYNAGNSEIPKGIDSALLLEQFEKAKSEALGEPTWDRVSIESQGIVTLGTNQPTLLAREALFVQKKGPLEFKSYLYLTADRNSFFKIRYSVRKSGGELQGTNREAVLREVGDLIAFWSSR